ncbi:MAG: hypothetical protein H0U27_11320 [Nitrosopumilus sp.]|nr:hypothetical protein [Nitrosopumilus sp.]
MEYLQDGGVIVYSTDIIAPLVVFLAASPITRLYYQKGKLHQNEETGNMEKWQ